MPDDSVLIRFSISHYQALLKLMIAKGAAERRLIGLLEEALAELPLAEVAAPQTGTLRSSAV